MRKIVFMHFALVIEMVLNVVCFSADPREEQLRKMFGTLGKPHVAEVIIDIVPEKIPQYLRTANGYILDSSQSSTIMTAIEEFIEKIYEDCVETLKKNLLESIRYPGKENNEEEEDEIDYSLLDDEEETVESDDFKTADDIFEDDAFLLTLEYQDTIRRVTFREGYLYYGMHNDEFLKGLCERFLDCADDLELYFIPMSPGDCRKICKGRICVSSMEVIEDTRPAIEHIKYYFPDLNINDGIIVRRIGINGDKI